jgi:hypothetical protein
MNAIQGVTLDMLAEIQAKYSALQAQYGEPGLRPHFLAFLQSKGLSEPAYVDAYNSWIARFRSDPTGQLEAQFSMTVGRLAAQAHYGDVRDMSGDAQEGVTLDTYAQLTVAMGKPGVDLEAIARQHGLAGVAHWQRVNAAWTAAMSQDTSHKLSMQYGQLYSRYAGPQFEQNMQNQVAATLAASRERPAAAAAPPREQTVDDLLQLLSAPQLRDRYRAARELAHRWDIGHERDPRLSAALACIPVLLEMVERHEEDQVGEAEDAARKLMELKQKNDDVKSAFQRCLNRATEHLATLERAFAPIQNQAVPERIPLQMKIGGYRSLIDTLRGMLAEWQPQGAGPAGPMPPFASPAPAAGAFAAAPGAAGTAPKRDYSMLVLAIVILVCAAAAVVAIKYKSQIRAEALSNPLASDSDSSEPAASSAPVASSSPPKPSATTQSKPPVAPANTATAAHPKKKK